MNVRTTIDITAYTCPETLAAVKSALDEAEAGSMLAIHMNDGEHIQNIPRAIKESGHKILKLIDNEDGTCDLIVMRAGQNGML